MEPRNEPPTAAEWGLWRAWAARHGISQAVIHELFGNGPNDFTREQAAQRLAEYARQL